MNWFAEEDMGEILQSVPVSGGCINDGRSVILKSGKRFFVKSNNQAPENMFAREAEGLIALTVHGGPYIPKIYLQGEKFLVLEDLKPGIKSKDFERLLGSQLAVIHQQVSNQFGYDQDNFIGSTPQQNNWTLDGYEFFAINRLRFQSELAENRGLLNDSEVEQINRIADKLSDLIPKQPASLLHGDLWHGNVIWNEVGQPALIDPAIYFGWAEADLAMTELFGGFGADFFAAYEDVRPLERDYRERFSLYNLYHLLNHLNLFGNTYKHQVKSILNRYA